MIKKCNSTHFEFIFFVAIFLFLIVAATAYAGGPEPTGDYDIKSGKIKGVLTVDYIPFDAASGTIDISIVGRCQKKESVEDKIIDQTLCSDCFSPVMTSAANFSAQDADALLAYMLPEVNLAGCFRPDLSPGEPEDLVITKVSDFILSESAGFQTITAVVTIRALE